MRRFLPRLMIVLAIVAVASWAAAQDAKQGPPPPGPDPKAVFQAMDKNGDGQLNLEEFTQGMRRLHARMQQTWRQRGEGPPALRRPEGPPQAWRGEGTPAMRRPEGPAAGRRLAGPPDVRHPMGPPMIHRPGGPMGFRGPEGAPPFHRGEGPPMARGGRRPSGGPPMGPWMGPGGPPRPAMAGRDAAHRGGPDPRGMVSREDVRRRIHVAMIERFKKADANKDGKLSREEAPARLKEHFSKIDANGDGQLTPAELKVAFQAHVKELIAKRSQADRKGDKPAHDKGVKEDKAEKKPDKPVKKDGPEADHKKDGPPKPPKPDKPERK